jgi:hypothetical protein
MNLPGREGSAQLLVVFGREADAGTPQWSEVDFQFGMLRKETSKTGAKVIPLARAALQILECESA